MKRFFIYAMSLLLAFPLVAETYTLTAEDLSTLDVEIKNKELYKRQKYQTLDSIKALLHKATTAEERYTQSIRLSEAYEAFISDSCFRYSDIAYQNAVQLNDKAKIVHSEISCFLALAENGLYLQANTRYENVLKQEIPESEKIYFYEASRQLYYYYLNHINYSGEMSEQYQAKYDELAATLYSEVPKNHHLYLQLHAEYLMNQKRYAEAKEELFALLKTVSPVSRQYAIITSCIAAIFQKENNESAAAHFNALSAICDIRGNIKENVALQNLSIYLYGQGDVARAYRYLQSSMDDANFCGARLRNVQISRHLSFINAAYQEQIQKKNDTLVIVIVIISLLVVALIVSLIYGIGQFRALNHTQEELKIANKLKSDYMGHFLDLCSIYIERLDALNKMIIRKINAKQYEDLLKMARSGKLVGEENRMFYDNFDSAFLHIYPNFVEDFNKLLLPEARVQPKELGTLTMELRIFAFFRMGISDCSKIASFLDYSINTIYAYRNRIRSKAINRDTFDEDVKNLGK